MPFYSRKPTRIPGYDYSTPNYYFVTICTDNKRCLFGKPKELNENGIIAWEGLSHIEERFPYIHVDNCIVMPNHIHAIFKIDEVAPGQGNSLETIIGLYKSGVSRNIHKKWPGIKVWQRSFHDRVIRNQQEYEQIWTYVQYNDQKWAEDCFFVDLDDMV